MPLYTYKCVKCNNNQEVDHPMMDSPEVLCKECGTVCKKIPGVGAVKFNGSGWGSDR